MTKEAQLISPVRTAATGAPCSDDNARSLWCAVIDRAITDLYRDQSVGRIQREEALTWIRDDPDFAEVCLLAGVDAVEVRGGVLRNLRASEQLKKTREGGRPIPSVVSDV